MTQEVKDINLETIESAAEDNAKPLVPVKMDLIGHVSVNVSVNIGTLDISIDKLFSMKPGDMLKLKEHVDSPMTLLVDDKPVAMGHLVIVDDCFGVKITKVADGKY
jgi:flagellar motor switch protein FliN/FliY